MLAYQNEIKKLNLPIDQYAVFGSGPMAIRNIRDSHDIDIIVTDELWELLLKQYPENIHTHPPSIRIGNIEIFNQWIIGDMEYSINEIIENKEVIDGISFAKLESVRTWKSQGYRKKDIEDVQLIDKYLENIKE